ncbi:MAG: hypothetical protein HFJ30_02035 [Clostridia bacterium]|nr:hypothetical protein [Clostridia bacterium]MCI9413453.1 hypothetical protein [Clostridia bacterium]
MKKNKKLIIIGVIAILVIITIILYFFLKNPNKNLNIGNNLSNKTLQEVEEYILNISSYEAEIEVSVESNKNKTKYVITQNYVSPNIEKQIVKEPSNIQGLETIYDGSKLTVHNSKLNLTTIYENYPYLTDNFLWLHSFIEEYRVAKANGQKTKLYEENNQIIMEVELSSSNQYIASKKLVTDKITGSIQKLIVQDKNQKNLVYILYNEIKMNSLKKEEVLAFRLQEDHIVQY